MAIENETQVEALERAFGTVITDVGFVQQVTVLGLTKEHFSGKIALDIGSGKRNRFANEIEEFVDNATVISVNPQLAFDGICTARGIDRSLHRPSVAALAQGMLPFQGESFDTIASVNGVPKHLTTEELPDLYNEVWRILMRGGNASFWPFCHQHTKGKAKVATNFVRIEEVDPRVLALLPEAYKDMRQRLVITKPNEGDLPSQISYLEE